MNAKDIRTALKAGKATVGTWLQFPSADVAELMARAGYDWVAIDMEHGAFGADVLPNVIRGIECGGAVPFARLPKAGKTEIKAALEAGAQGLIFPMIESGEQLARAVDLATYPGLDFWREPGETAGEYRGVGFCRANAFGQNFEAYRELTKDIVLVAQIEHARAVKRLPEILTHKRLDAIMVGPYDLSGSLGITGQFESPKFKAVMAEIAAACAKFGVPMGAHVVDPDEKALVNELARGSKFVAYGIDTVFLWKAARRPLRKDEA